MTSEEFAEECAKDQAEMLIIWLQNLPDRAEVHWCSDHMGTEKPYAVSYVDVSIPKFNQLMGWNWTLTIQALDDPDPVGPLIWAVPFDGEEQGTPAWSPAAVTEALRWWASEHAERHDLRWVWDADAPPSLMMQQAQKKLEQMEADDDFRVMIRPAVDGKPAVYAHREVVDMLYPVENTLAEVFDGEGAVVPEDAPGETG